MHKIYKKSLKANVIEELKQLEKDHSGAWVNITAPDDTDLDLIRSQTHLNNEEIYALFDEFERPRIEKNEDNIIIVFHIPLLVDNFLETTPLVIVITTESIITICRHETQIVSDFIQGTFLSFNTTMKTRFVLLLLKRINYYFDRTMRTIDQTLEQFEKNLLKYTDNKEIGRIFNIKKSLIYFNTSVIANGKVLRRVTGGHFLPLFDEDKEILEDIIVDNDQIKEIVAIYSDIITSSLDTYTSVVSNNMNMVMKSLTAVTITLAIPTVVASLWGMNVKVPLADNSLAFAFVVILALVLTFSVNFFYLKKK